MGTDASWPLQQAISHRLRAHSGVQKLLQVAASTSNRDGEERGGERPLDWRYGDGAARSWHSATFDGQEHDIGIELWVDETVWPAREVAACFIDALHNADLQLNGHALVDLQFEQSETRTCEQRGQTHCILRFRALTVVD